MSTHREDHLKSTSRHGQSISLGLINPGVCMPPQYAQGRTVITRRYYGARNNGARRAAEPANALTPASAHDITE